MRVRDVHFDVLVNLLTSPRSYGSRWPRVLVQLPSAVTGKA
jgi:hypothetical protein